MLTPETLAKLTRLRRLLQADERVVLAYSGGIDSSLLAYLGQQMLGDNLLAVTCVSPLLPPAERIAARRFAASHGIRHMEWPTPDLDCDAVAHNAPDRCYHCKYRRFAALLEYARTHGYRAVWEGSNIDDLGQYRPGLRALRELPVTSPYLGANFTKADIRDVARHLGLSIWDKPAAPCLATRFPYGTELDAPTLTKVAVMETLLRTVLGEPLRLRYDGRAATIEADAKRLARISAKRKQKLLQCVRQFGIEHVQFAPDGYRSGRYDPMVSLDFGK